MKELTNLIDFITAGAVNVPGEQNALYELVAAHAPFDAVFGDSMDKGEYYELREYFLMLRAQLFAWRIVEQGDIVPPGYEPGDMSLLTVKPADELEPRDIIVATVAGEELPPLTIEQWAAIERGEMDAPQGEGVTLFVVLRLAFEPVNLIEQIGNIVERIETFAGIE